MIFYKAKHQVNLVTLPAFSINKKEDKYTAAQGLQKCCYAGELQHGMINKSLSITEMPSKANSLTGLTRSVTKHLGTNSNKI